MTESRVAVIGAGAIGSLVVAHLSRRHDVVAYDRDADHARAAAAGGAHSGTLDVTDAAALEAALEDAALVINCCPHFCNLPIARVALGAGVSYLDLSEDVASGRAIEALADGFEGYVVPRCGVAPGLVQIVAGHLVGGLDTIDAVHLRVGALPEHPVNALKYNLTWSTDGLINEYGNPCEAIAESQVVSLDPLDGDERVIIDGVEYEAFNTSGGLGTLVESLAGRVRELNYRTLRYPGHRDLMRFLMVDLGLNERRDLLGQVLEAGVPRTREDVVVVQVRVTGVAGSGGPVERVYEKTIRHGMRYERPWTAIQLATASAAAAVADLALTGQLPHTGYVRQEEIDFEAFTRAPDGGLFAT